MKFMRFLSAACVVLSAVIAMQAGVACAEDRKVFGVALTPEQQEQFKKIVWEAEPAKAAIRENKALPDEEKEEKMKAVYDGIKAKLKAILTPAQVKEMEAAEAEQSSRQVNYVPNKIFGITLTPEQHEKLKKIMAEAEPAKKAIRENPDLSNEQKIAQMKAVYEGIKSKLKPVLTPEQVKQMESAGAAQKAEK